MQRLRPAPTPARRRPDRAIGLLVTATLALGWAPAAFASSVTAQPRAATVAKAKPVRPPAVRAATVVRRPSPVVRAATVPAARPVFGLSARDDAALTAAERALGLVSGAVGVFSDWTQPFPAADASAAARRGAVLVISWEPQDSGLHSVDQPLYALDRITAGGYDDYIRSWARAAARIRIPVFVRWAPEMNGDWEVWSTGVNGNGPGDYAAAWRHVRAVARAAGGTNLVWVFNPMISYEGSYPLSALWPGADQVDWVALDGYNWGYLKPWGWQSWDDIFPMGLAEIRRVAPGKPLAVTEIASAPGPGDKAAWVTDTLGRARAAGVRMLVWFEHDKETDWRLSSSPPVAAAARAAVRSGWTTGGDARAVRRALGL